MHPSAARKNLEVPVPVLLLLVLPMDLAELHGWSTTGWDVSHHEMDFSIALGYQMTGFARQHARVAEAEGFQWPTNRFHTESGLILLIYLLGRSPCMHCQGKMLAPLDEVPRNSMVDLRRPTTSVLDFARRMQHSPAAEYV